MCISRFFRAGLNRRYRNPCQFRYGGCGRCGEEYGRACRRIKIHDGDGASEAKRGRSRKEGQYKQLARSCLRKRFQRALRPLTTGATNSARGSPRYIPYISLCLSSFLSIPLSASLIYLSIYLFIPWYAHDCWYNEISTLSVRWSFLISWGETDREKRDSLESPIIPLKTRSLYVFFDVLSSAACIFFLRLFYSPSLSRFSGYFRSCESLLNWIVPWRALVCQFMVKSVLWLFVTVRAIQHC